MIKINWVGKQKGSGANRQQEHAHPRCIVPVDDREHIGAGPMENIVILAGHELLVEVAHGDDDLRAADRVFDGCTPNAISARCFMASASIAGARPGAPITRRS